MDTSQIFSQMTILFAILAIGFIAAKAKVLTPESNRHLSSLVLYVTNPCTILYSVLSADAALTKRELLLLTVIAVVFYAALIGIAHFVPKLLRVRGDLAGIYRFMTVFPNVGFMGFPVVKAVFGQGAVFYAAIFNLFFQFYLYTWGVRQISHDPRDGRLNLRTALQPVIIASLLAYLIYLFDLKPVITATVPGQLLTSVLSMVNGVTSPLSMIITGVGLSMVPIRKVLTNGRLYLLAIGKQILLPIAVFFLLSPIVKNELTLGICVIMAAMPVATSASLFCAQYNGPADEAASGIFLSTLLSVAAVPLVMMLLF